MGSESGIEPHYSIGEVAEMTGLEAYVLRYWETEFEQLSPRKNRAGNRAYTQGDLAVVLRIRHLLREDKYTIEGARQVFSREDGEASNLTNEQEELLELRSFLEKILERL